MRYLIIVLLCLACNPVHAKKVRHHKVEANSASEVQHVKDDSRHRNGGDDVVQDRDDYDPSSQAGFIKDWSNPSQVTWLELPNISYMLDRIHPPMSTAPLEVVYMPDELNPMDKEAIKKMEQNEGSMPVFALALCCFIAAVATMAMVQGHPVLSSARIWGAEKAKESQHDALFHVYELEWQSTASEVGRGHDQSG